MAEDLYAVLGVPKGADEATVKKAYRKLAKTLHPDKHPGDAKAEARFKEVNHAFDVLSDAKKRGLYEEFGEEGLREGFDPERTRAYKRWASQQTPGTRGGGARTGGGVRLKESLSGNAASGTDFSEFIGDMFTRGRAKRGPTPGADLQASVTIDFASAVRGTMLELKPQGALPGAEPVKVRIPQGAHDGSRVRIAGHGAASPDGGAPGDLLLDIHVEPHKFFRREGEDLHLDLPITIVEAMRGGKVKVPTIDGSVSLTVTPGTQSGSTARLRGKGVTRKGHTGDLYVHYQVNVPSKVSPEVEALLDALAKLPAEDPREGLVL